MVSAKTFGIAIVVVLIIAVGAFMFIQSNAHNTQVDVISNSTLKNGDNVQIVLKDEYRNVYPGEVVYIKILGDDGWGNTYEVTTDNEGEASVTLATYDNGNYTIHTNYNGTLFNKAYHGVNQLTIDDGYN